MSTFVSKPVEIEAVQFTGDNWDEMELFTGTREVGEEGHRVRVFTPIGTYLPVHLYNYGVAELWTASISVPLVLEVGDWVVRVENGFRPLKKATFEAEYESIEEN